MEECNATALQLYSQPQNRQPENPCPFSAISEHQNHSIPREMDVVPKYSKINPKSHCLSHFPPGE